MFSKRWKYPTKAGGGRGARLLRIYAEWYGIRKKTGGIHDEPVRAG